MRFRRVLGRLPSLAGLTVVWVLLNGDLTVGNVLGGLAVSAAVLLLLPTTPGTRRHEVHPLGILRFLGFVAWSLVTSSWAVAVTVVRPTDGRLRAGIVRCELPGASPLVVTLVANAITLTPGTLTVTAEAGEHPVLHVHALGLGDLDAFRAGISDLQARATAAVTPRRPREARR